jgi:hypothetical protein
MAQRYWASKQWARSTLSGYSLDTIATMAAAMGAAESGNIA